MSDRRQGPDQKGDLGVVTERRQKLARPPLYKVLLHNDDYTTKEFVVMILQGIFRKSEGDANIIMLHVHNNGVGLAGVYTFEVAETKIEKTMQLAKRYEYPLQVTMEPE